MKKFIVLVLTVALSCSLLLFNASAESGRLINIDMKYSLYYPGENTEYITLEQTVPNNSAYRQISDTVSGVPMDYAMELHYSATMNYADGGIMISAGDTFDFSLTGLQLLVQAGSNLYFWNIFPDTLYIALNYTDGSIDYLSTDVTWNYNSQNRTASVRVSGVAEKDVASITYYQDITQYSVTLFHGIGSAGLYLDNDNVPVYIEVILETKTEVLLDDIVNGEATPEQSPIDDNVNDLIGKEDQLIQDTEQGRENIITYITQALSELTAYATAFVALNAIIDGFFYLPIIGPLIVISMAMGIFGMIVNLAQSATRTDKATRYQGKGKT